VNQSQLLSVRVLVVDDSPDIREVVVQMLEHHGATVAEVGTAEEALDVLEASRPDVLLSDLEMPGKDGYWLIGRVRALVPDRGGLTPAACLTARIDPDTRASVLKAGFQYHIPKPPDMSRLVGIVGILALKP
jgi:CheY-like chemotaxis protein